MANTQPPAPRPNSRRTVLRDTDSRLAMLRALNPSISDSRSISAVRSNGGSSHRVLLMDRSACGALLRRDTTGAGGLGVLGGHASLSCEPEGRVGFRRRCMRH
jgi:hypothetical protein